MKDNKKLPQMIILGVLVAVLVGYVAVSFMGGPKKSAPAAAQKNAPAAQTQTAQEAEPENTDKSEVSIVATAASVPVANRRDPFAPAMDIRIKSNTFTPQNTQPIRIATGGGNLPPLGVGPLPPIGTGPIPGTNPGSNLPIGNEQTPIKTEDAIPNFVLTGIITGRNNVAIIRLGDGRFICKEGQTINGSYKVVSVSQDGVLLSRDGRSVFLKLGGEGNAS